MDRQREKAGLTVARARGLEFDLHRPEAILSLGGMTREPDSNVLLYAAGLFMAGMLYLLLWFLAGGPGL